MIGRPVQRVLLLSVVLLVLAGCQKLGSTEHAVRFWKLPPVIGGGVSTRVYTPGETVIEIPILSEIYSLQTGVRYITWGESSKAKTDFVHTRALDGNEVALSVTVSYEVDPSGENLRHIFTKVATSDAELRSIVMAAARADIRTFMNQIRTSDFIENEARVRAVRSVQEALTQRLKPFGIKKVRVNLDDFKFWRQKPDGTIDTSYEDMLRQIQQRREEIGRETARIETVRQKKQKELNEVRARAQEILEAAEGYKQQAVARGDAYLLAKKNEADAIVSVGEARAQGIKEQVEALSGPGGKELLKLEIAKELLKSGSKFVVLSPAEGSGDNEMRLNRMDSNQLLEQLGLIELSREKDAAAAAQKQEPVAAQQETTRPEGRN